jgi:hypothetical protein
MRLRRRSGKTALREMGRGEMGRPRRRCNMTCRMAEQEKCTCSCDGVNHGIAKRSDLLPMEALLIENEAVQSAIKDIRRITRDGFWDASDDDLRASEIRK